MKQLGKILMKKNYVKRIMAGMLTAVMMLTTAFSGAGGVLNAEAASTYETQNLLTDSDFEDNVAFGAGGSGATGNWLKWQSAARVTEDAQSGEASVKISAGDSTIEQNLDGSKLIPGMEYVYTVWAKVSGTISAKHIVGVKNYGGEEIQVQVDSTTWKKYEIPFVYTSGNPNIFGYIGTPYDGVEMYIDNASVVVKSDVQSVEIKNGLMTVDFVDTYEGMPTVDQLAATYTVTPRNVSGTMQWTNCEWDPVEKVATLEFAEFEKIPVEQTVAVNLTYGSATITLDFTIAANGEDVVTANLNSIGAENGQITAVLDVEPTIDPTAADFTWEYQINDGEYKALEVENFAYDRADKTISVDFDVMHSVTEVTVTVKVTYNKAFKEAQFTLTASNANTYYVDATGGNDSNNGLSEENAFASIAKLNTMKFLPGDQILFKKGETFVGCFKPQGSGTETAPITIGSYGDAKDRPKLQPGADWTVPHIMSANAIVRNAKVNYVLQFYNVEYWEVSDLEIVDPNSEAYLIPDSGKYIGNSANDVYRSGITIQAEDIGTLEHFYIDNVEIHGFHGPGTNIGKTSGGITMNVITNGERDRSQSVPTQINDIRVTNCEIYDVGRSGINFLTPWSFRTEEKWGPFDYGNPNYEYLPYEDFYMANNYIHDIDGDGTIIDNCSGAIAEYNLVTRCCLRPKTENPVPDDNGAAVGLFNWNSNDTIFQFNEVYDIRLGVGPYAANDGQGIEIDALNDRTWVQYNYVHDNWGGFMMLCNISDNYRSFDGIVRYNISQNDHAHPRQGMFDIYSANYGTEIYNNTFYLTDKALNSAGEVFLFSAVGSYDTMKFYNNIFYYDGETPVRANEFGDGAIDWQSNIFYGFENLPQNDNENAPNISVDPEVVNIGAGATGTIPGTMPDLSCYYLEAESPAINAGVPVEDNGGRDFFGNKVSGIPDIGAYESRSVVLKVLSSNSDIFIAQDTKTITMVDVAENSVKDLMESLIYEADVTVSVKRGEEILTDDNALADGDVVTVEYDGESISYVVKVVEYYDYNKVKVTASSEETKGEVAPAAYVSDGDEGTFWHSKYSDEEAASPHWIQLELADVEEINRFVYVPRQSGGNNGIFTRYKLEVSVNGTEWTEVATGTWGENKSTKTVDLTPVEARYVKLTSVDTEETQGSVGGFGSAAEIKIYVTEVNKAALVAAIEAATGKVEAEYTVATWEALEEALEEAKALSAKEDAKQTDVDAATKALNDAIAALEKAPTPEVKKDQWMCDSKGWWYSYANGGYAKNCWEKINEKWYWFDAEGYMVTGWKQIGGTWYYLNESGEMVTGWKQIGGIWYYLNASGEMVTGWKQISGIWYYFNTSGAMVTGWVKDGATWYYMNRSGEMATGWKQIGGAWYYLNESGEMVTGWLQQGSTWYYLKSDGAMAVGKLKIGNRMNSFASSGAWLGYI